MPHAACSPANDDLPASSSGSLVLSEVDSIPTASTPRDTEDAEVGSQEGTHQGEAPEAPQGDLPDSRPKGDEAPPLARRASLRRRWPPSNRRRRIACWRRSMAPPLKRNTALVMSVVIQKVQLAKSGLTEACSSLLTGFEVRISIYIIV